MPRMNTPQTATTLAKLLLIGDGKLGKSYYAAMAAKAGFNVLYLDGDVGSATIGKMIKEGTLTAEEASRIYLLDIRDTIASGLRDSKMVEFMNEFTSSTVIRWHDGEQRVATRKDTGEIWEIRPGRMGINDLIVMDSWTSYTESVMLWVGRANGVNVGDASTSEMRPVYQGGGLKSTEMLQVIRSSPTNWLVLAHPDEYQHTTLKEGVIKGKAKETDQIVDWTKMIAKTTSKPQGLVMPKYFTDVAWMELSPTGKERRVSFKQSNDRVGGGHLEDVKSVDEYSFGALYAAMGNVPPTPAPSNELPSWINITHIDAAESAANALTSTIANGAKEILDGTKPTAIKGTGLSSLMKKA